MPPPPAAARPVAARRPGVATATLTSHAYAGIVEHAMGAGDPAATVPAAAKRQRVDRGVNPS